MEPESPLPYSRKSSTCPYSDRQIRSRSPSYFINTHFNTTLPSTAKSSKGTVFLSHRSGRQPKTYVNPETVITVSELLMMGGVSPETCWAIKKHWNNKFYYTVAFCWFFLWDLCYDARIHEHHLLTFQDNIQKSEATQYVCQFIIRLREISYPLHYPALYTPVPTHVNNITILSPYVTRATLCVCSFPKNAWKHLIFNS